MTVWGIADLHLSFARPMRRERYAARWADHAARIEQHWREAVRPGDVVLVPGDISMARNHRELQPDLAWLDQLPGTKVLSAGNHDRWFNRVEAIRPMLRPSLRAVGGDAVGLPGLIVCGTRGVPPWPEEAVPPERREELQRELAALEAALGCAGGLRAAGEPILVLWHYPPFDEFGRPGPCVERLEAAGVAHCLYGHVHAEGQWSRMVQGLVRGVRYHCVAADAIGFHPLRIAEVGAGEGGIGSPP
jgi:predicted phosphohydrolase